MPLMERRAAIVWEGDLKGTGRLTVDSGAIPEQQVTFSARTESADGKTSPEELISAAHATCYAMSLSNVLAREGFAPERLEVSAVTTLDRTEAGLKITSVHLTARGKAGEINEAKFKELAQVAEGRCPVSNALRGNVEIRVTADRIT